MSSIIKQLDDNIIIVTGSNTGIGYETALELAKRNATVILACRDEKRANEAAQKIISESKNDKVYVEILDLGSLQSVRNFVDRFKAKYNRLDILINNAGLIGVPFIKTEDGHESTFQINHLGHFLLTNLLLDLLKSSAPSRIINVSSKYHYYAKMNWDDLYFEKDYEATNAYAQSKLANILERCESCKGTNVTAVCVHPGIIKTDIWRDRNNPSFVTKLKTFLLNKPYLMLFGVSIKEGAETTLYCALADEVLNQGGSYYEKSKLTPASRDGANLDFSKKLWTISSKMVGISE